MQWLTAVDFYFYRTLCLVVNDGELKESNLISRMKEACEKETKVTWMDLVMDL